MRSRTQLSRLNIHHDIKNKLDQTAMIPIMSLVARVSLAGPVSSITIKIKTLNTPVEMRTTAGTVASATVAEIRSFFLPRRSAYSLMIHMIST